MERSEKGSNQNMVLDSRQRVKEPGGSCRMAVSRLCLLLPPLVSHSTQITSRPASFGEEWACRSSLPDKRKTAGRGGEPLKHSGGSRGYQEKRYHSEDGCSLARVRVLDLQEPVKFFFKVRLYSNVGHALSAAASQPCQLHRQHM